ncbi:protein-methionine-sulfoxide reductase heme-binding subunit MsrQ [Paraferrimonas haliotis]|uniref:Protein-methionine-sulfoxide reductase heme-binding subunit MsrQ n=1 Tax=Paraferrimonas haliotis TaxID=2013866 RepID=A0AA37TPQ9_9GAMM|nr:protein-methionine-sulfoxide reductase heme-binding subunit MsrQ [Paraferrimonas haliotis]GLS84718.1 protein-methionine-sulfoxide reductase heme-binding subunit MsrQ [Paraferrimonas haliotis]
MGGRGLVAVKVLMHLLALTPTVLLVVAVGLDKAGGDPVQYIIHFTGKGALNALIATLLITPIARRFGWSWLMQCRRLVGLYVMFYAALHISAFIALDLVFDVKLLASEILKRPYISIGFIAFVIVTALAITSLKSIRKNMGKNWQLLHGSVYPLALLVVWHYYWSVRSDVVEPIFYGVAVLLLLWARWPKVSQWLQAMRRACAKKAAPVNSVR